VGLRSGSYPGIAEQTFDLQSSVAGAPVLLKYRGRHTPAAGQLDAIGGSPCTDRFEVDGRAGASARRALPAHLARLADVAVESTTQLCALDSLMSMA